MASGPLGKTGQSVVTRIDGHIEVLFLAYIGPTGHVNLKLQS
jgi:hypothetical protein